MNVDIPSQLLEAEGRGNSTKLFLAVKIPCVVVMRSFCSDSNAEKENNGFLKLPYHSIFTAVWFFFPD